MKTSRAFASLAIASSLFGCPSTNMSDARGSDDAGFCDPRCLTDDAPSAVDARFTDDAVLDAFVLRDASSMPDSGPSSALGDCDSNADCPGGRCIALSTGYRVCQVDPVPATACDPERPDACCTSADCTAPAQCFLGPIVPHCGGAFRLPFNECATDECASTSDCGTGICIPKGVTSPIAHCVAASACRADSDCNAEPGGHCILASDPCCSTRTEMACRYPTNGCSTNADCPSGHCGVSGGRSVCMSGGPICPG